MVQNDSSTATCREQDGGVPWMVDETTFYGLIAVLIGASQLPLSVALAPSRASWAFVIGSGGMLLLSIGTNLVLGRQPFESSWGKSGKLAIFGTLLIIVFTIAVAVTSAYIFVTI